MSPVSPWVTQQGLFILVSVLRKENQYLSLRISCRKRALSHGFSKKVFSI